MALVSARVLIVEDDGDLRHLYGSWLALAGFRVQTATDGISALQHVDADPPDLLLLDLGLPLLRGEHVANELAAQAHTRAIPVVVVTGQPSALAPAAAACVLRKPVEHDELIDTVRRCLATRIAGVAQSKRKSKPGRRR
jgi:DNA-binding response OmpR family regulator